MLHIVRDKGVTLKKFNVSKEEKVLSQYLEAIFFYALWSLGFGKHCVLFMYGVLVSVSMVTQHQMGLCMKGLGNMMT